jgi:hypothetical protein
MTGWVKPDLDSDKFGKAVNAIYQRAEKQLNVEKLIETYVHTDLASRAMAPDSQLVLGRRGTGKTHMFRVLQEKLGGRGEVTHYIDCRLLGSGLISSTEKPEQVAQKYFRTLLNDIGTYMLDKAINMEMPPAGLQQKVLGATIHGFATQMEPSLTEEIVKPTFNYRQIYESLRAILADLRIDHLFIIIDEWAQIPISAQPYVAEYLKRAIMTIPEVCIKLLAVNYQYQLSKQSDEGIIGIQSGADITNVLDFDSYLIYDENPDLVKDFFSEVLYNHLGAELLWDLKVTREEKTKRILDIFTQQNSFVELVRAAEGNCRDFLCIFGKAFWEGYRQQRDARAISIPHIRDAASSWFDYAKYINIRDDTAPNKALIFIMNNIIKGYKSRTFMVEASKAQSPVLTRLLNERILHKLSGFYSHKDRPGERYELFNIDYGAYVRFISTKETVNESSQGVFPFMSDVPKLSADEQKFMVPRDDKRSIRRIVFDPDVLKVTT